MPRGELAVLRRVRDAADAYVKAADRKPTTPEIARAQVTTYTELRRQVQRAEDKLGCVSESSEVATVGSCDDGETTAGTMFVPSAPLRRPSSLSRR